MRGWIFAGRGDCKFRGLGVRVLGPLEEQQGGLSEGSRVGGVKERGLSPKREEGRSVGGLWPLVGALAFSLCELETRVLCRGRMTYDLGLAAWWRLGGYRTRGRQAEEGSNTLVPWMGMKKCPGQRPEALMRTDLALPSGLTLSILGRWPRPSRGQPSRPRGQGWRSPHPVLLCRLKPPCPVPLGGGWEARPCHPAPGHC